ncbi:DUF2474 family protein [Cobetia amphilecti]
MTHEAHEPCLKTSVPTLGLVSLALRRFMQAAGLTP